MSPVRTSFTLTTSFLLVSLLVAEVNDLIVTIACIMVLEIERTMVDPFTFPMRKALSNSCTICVQHY